MAKETPSCALATSPERLPIRILTSAVHRIGHVFLEDLLAIICASVTKTLTLTHSEKSIQQMLVAWPYRRERRGHDPREKESVKAGVGCAVGKVCTYTL